MNEIFHFFRFDVSICLVGLYFDLLVLIFIRKTTKKTTSMAFFGNSSQTTGSNGNGFFEKISKKIRLDLEPETKTNGMEKLGPRKKQRPKNIR